MMLRPKLAAAAALLGLALGTTPAAAATPGVYYESFAHIELASLSLASPNTVFGFYGGNPTNISAAGPQVYWQDGFNILRANYDLTGATLFHANNFIPTDFAVDAAHGVYYESFAGIELAALSLANPNSAIGFRGGNPTNISVGGDYVYWQDGVNIWRANPDLSDAQIFHANNFIPTDFAVDAAHGVYYESFAGIELAALSLTDPLLLIGEHGGNATHIAVGDDGVYWQDGVDIDKANFDLSDPTIFHTNNFIPTNFAVQPAIPDPPGGGAGGVPEPATWALMLVGFGALGAALRQRRAPAAARA